MGAAHREVARRQQGQRNLQASAHQTHDHDDRALDGHRHGQGRGLATAHKINDAANGTARRRLQGCRGVGGAVVKNDIGPLRLGGLQFHRIDVGHHQAGPGHQAGRGQRRQAQTARAYQQNAVRGLHGWHFLQGAKGGQPRAGQRGGGMHIQRANVDQVAGVGHQHVLAEAAIGFGAQAALGFAIGVAQVLAGLADAAAYPGVDQHLATRPGGVHVGAHLGHAARDFMAQGHGNLGAILRGGQAFVAAQVEIAVAQMDVAVAQPGRLHLDQHLLALGHRLRHLARLQGLAPIHNLIALHGVCKNPKTHPSQLGPGPQVGFAEALFSFPISPPWGDG